MMTLVIYGAVAMGLVFGLGVCVGCIVELKAKIKEDKELEELKDGEDETLLEIREEDVHSVERLE